MTGIAESIYEKVTSPFHKIIHPTKSAEEESKMNALIWYGKEDMRYEEVPKPLVADTDEVLLRVTSSSFCGSKSEDVVGHEFMGIIEDIGKDIHNLEIGQRVVVAFDIACGICEYCQKGLYTVCDIHSEVLKSSKTVGYGRRTEISYGYSHLTGGVLGGLTEYVLVPYAEFNCLPVPEEIPDEKALFLADLIPTAYYGTELAKVKENDIVGIWGLGPIGLMVAKWCFIKKVKKIIGIECVPERIQIAKQFGIEVIDFSKIDPIKEISNIFPNGLDCAIDCVGNEYSSSWIQKFERVLRLETDPATEVLSQCISAVKKFGTVTVIGAYSGYTNKFPIGPLLEKGITLNGGQAPIQKYWEYSKEKVLSGELNPSFVITHRGSLADGPNLFKKFSKREDGVLKVFLQPDAIWLLQNKPSTTTVTTTASTTTAAATTTTAAAAEQS
jgi:threonine dehydrogenase-like Zn-dependent dehydrogenase